MSQVIISQEGNAGLITLNRPEALNAMSIDMVNQMAEALQEFAADEAIKLVIVTSSSARAFCAGGDVREAVSIIEQNPEIGAEPYFLAEYGFDVALATFPKPVVALVDGIVMGGGLGLARLSDFMVVSSAIKMAMPETAIGLFPDVGASYFLRRAPLEAAIMMGMTGTMIGAGDAMAWQIADAHCPADDFEALRAALASATDRNQIETILAGHHKPAPATELAQKMTEICDVFGQKTPQEIAQAAKAYATASGEKAWHEALNHKCPTSIAAFWHMMIKEDMPDTSEAAIRRDYFLACKMTRRADFAEGVRAVLIDKDNAPAWAPHSLSQITEEMLADLFDFAGMTPLPEACFTPKT